MEKQINDKIKDLNDSAGSQEELMKALAQIDEEGQLTDDVLDAVSGGALSGFKLPDIAGGMTTGNPPDIDIKFS